MYDHRDHVAEICSRLFASMPRRGQRLKAEQYVRALLSVPGRKTLRNIADWMEGEPADREPAKQSVHHFISNSSWDWTRVRHALAGYVEDTVAPRAWVVRPLVIPKAGPHSVGVDQQFVPHLGLTVHGQQAYGAWLASEHTAVPCDWSLLLTRTWLDDPGRRRRAQIPAGTLPAGPEEVAGRLALDASRGLPSRRPVVIDAEGLDPTRMLRMLVPAGVPAVVRVPASTPLRVDPAVLHSYSERPSTADQLVAGCRWLWRPAEGRGVRAALPVVLPAAPRQPLLLLARWTAGTRGPDRYWLATTPALGPAPGSGTPAGSGTPSGLGTHSGCGTAPVPGAPPGVGAARGTGAPYRSDETPLALAVLADTVELAFRQVSEQTGIRDFAGRSFQGWHRHMTLASAAHAAAVLRDRRAVQGVRAA
ncbi:IS701 family transposase [Streptomyces neyagawaensis]|uniref:IS701 family transposase n=1 Tax=Streptomyces neyagawaensis TaxID=42238 RepID=UPI0006E29057|nr:transposase [Streptomyces neyagawaensis]MCL6733095.1 transposase [Streptomyces neyagawaensis]MDE1687639.1 transposase [Streptomyces neyagawaensis]